MRMTSLPAGYIENPGAGRQAENVDQPRDFVPVALELEDRLILEEIMGIEIRLPPFTFLQKKTGSLYAPKMSSMAARISYRVQ